MTRGARLYLEDIKNSINKIEKYAGKLSFDKFKKDEKTVDAVVRNLEIIGEAAKNIPQGIKEKYTYMPWRKMVGMRNKVIHEYFGVDVEILWKTVKEDIPALKKTVQGIKISS